MGTITWRTVTSANNAASNALQLAGQKQISGAFDKLSGLVGQRQQDAAAIDQAKITGQLLNRDATQEERQVLASLYGSGVTDPTALKSALDAFKVSRDAQRAQVAKARENQAQRAFDAQLEQYKQAGQNARTRMTTGATLDAANARARAALEAAGIRADAAKYGARQSAAASKYGADTRAEAQLLTAYLNGLNKKGSSKGGSGKTAKKKYTQEDATKLIKDVYGLSGTKVDPDKTGSLVSGVMAALNGGATVDQVGSAIGSTINDPYWFNPAGSTTNLPSDPVAGTTEFLKLLDTATANVGASGAPQVDPATVAAARALFNK